MRSLLNRRETFFAPIEDHFNRLFDQFFGPESLQAVRSRGRSGYPKLDVVETDKEYVIEFAVPGVDPDALKVEILPEESDGKMFGIDSGRKVLKLSGKMDYEYQYPEGTTFHYKELRRSQFSREVILPEYVTDDPTATYESGILKLVWSKPEEAKKPEPKQIPITKKA